MSKKNKKYGNVLFWGSIISLLMFYAYRESLMLNSEQSREKIDYWSNKSSDDSLEKDKVILYFEK